MGFFFITHKLYKSLVYSGTSRRLENFTDRFLSWFPPSHFQPKQPAWLTCCCQAYQQLSISKVKHQWLYVQVVDKQSKFSDPALKSWTIIKHTSQRGQGHREVSIIGVIHHVRLLIEQSPPLPQTTVFCQQSGCYAADASPGQPHMYQYCNSLPICKGDLQESWRETFYNDM